MCGSVATERARVENQSNDYFSEGSGVR